ncbi:MAG TPA: hypothetical protein DDX98_05810 [Bacteroidales bacterium]|jgi:hypothetical protein|nr:hypothetical protein [Bacteroidales bacterium]
MLWIGTYIAEKPYSPYPLSLKNQHSSALTLYKAPVDTLLKAVGDDPCPQAANSILSQIHFKQQTQ